MFWQVTELRDFFLDDCIFVAFDTDVESTSDDFRISDLGQSVSPTAVEWVLETQIFFSFLT